MVDACNEAKVPLPRYELRPGGIAIIFERPKPQERAPRFTKDFIKDFIKEKGLQLSDRQAEILLLISEDPTITSQKISEELSHKNSASSRTIIKDTNYLQEIKVLKRIGSRKDGYWDIQF